MKNNMTDLVKSSADLVAQDEQLASLYRESAEIGAGNLSGSLPTLKIHATGRSKDNQLINGKEPNDGWFFYAPTQEQFETLNIHILSISRGYRTEGLEDKNKLVYTQLMAGVIDDNDDLKPFIFYFTGLKLNNLWEFGKEAKAYTHRKPVPIPMFALTVKMDKESIKHEYGKAWVPTFEILKDKTGFPELITDPGKFVFIRDHVSRMEEVMEQVISLKSDKDPDEITDFLNQEETMNDAKAQVARDVL